MIFPQQQANLIVGHFPRTLSDEEDQNFLSACIERPGKAWRKKTVVQYLHNMLTTLPKTENIFCYDLLSSIYRFGKKQNLGLTAIVRRFQSSCISIDAD